MTMTATMWWKDAEGAEHRISVDSKHPPIMIDPMDILFLWECSCGAGGEWENIVVSTMTANAHRQATTIQGCLCDGCVEKTAEIVTEIAERRED